MKIAILAALLFAGLLITILLGLIAPGVHRDTSIWKGLMIAHRGLHDSSIPENSLPAFKAAAEQKYGVELDVQFTKDKQLIVFHDSTLTRMCGIDKRVRDCTYEELMQYTLLNTDEHIPRFEDVLKIIDGLPLVCELKDHNGLNNHRLCRATYELLSVRNGQYCIESFSPFLVRWFRIHHPEVIRGQLSCNMKKENMFLLLRPIMSTLLINVISRPDFIAYRHNDINELGFLLCKRLFHPLTFGWTARGQKEQEHAWRNFDSVIFELNEQTDSSQDK